MYCCINFKYKELAFIFTFTDKKDNRDILKHLNVIQCYYLSVTIIVFLIQYYFELASIFYYIFNFYSFTKERQYILQFCLFIKYFNSCFSVYYISNIYIVHKV